MSFFLGSWGMNRSAEQTNHPRTHSLNTLDFHIKNKYDGGDTEGTDSINNDWRNSRHLSDSVCTCMVGLVCLYS